MARDLNSRLASPSRSRQNRKSKSGRSSNQISKSLKKMTKGLLVSRRRSSWVSMNHRTSRISVRLSLKCFKIFIKWSRMIMIGLSSPSFSKFTSMESLALTSFSVFLMKSMATRLVRLWERKSKCYSLLETTVEELILTSSNHGMILRTKDLTRCQGQATAKLVLISSSPCAQLRWTQSMAFSLDNIWTTNIYPFQWDQKISNSKSETRTRIWFLEMKTTCIVWILR